MTRALRVLMLAMLVVVLQVALFPHVRMFGVVPDVGLVLAVAVAYYDGPEAGALTGFVAGFMYDLFLETPLGLSALTYALTAHAVGVMRAGMLRSPRWLPVALGSVAGALGATLFALMGILVGVDALRSGRTVGVVVVSALYAALLAPFVFRLVRVTLRTGEERAPAAW